MLRMPTSQKSLQLDLSTILTVKVAQVKSLIEEAVRCGFTFDILVCGRPHVDQAEKMMTKLGIERSQYCILPDLPEHNNPNRLQIKFGNLIAS